MIQTPPFAPMASGGLGITYIYFVEGPFTIIVWNVIFLVINFAQVIYLLWERRDVTFSEEEETLYRAVFGKFTQVEFLKILSEGRWGDAAAESDLAVQGKPINNLIVIANGEVAIMKDGGELARLRDGALIGEMSLLRGGDASATVRAAMATRYLSWPKEKLRAFLRRHETIDLAMQSVLLNDIVNKLAGAPPEEAPEDMMPAG